MKTDPIPQAAIDIGSNTVHLVVKVYRGKQAQTLSRKTEMIQLGRCVAQTGLLPASEQNVLHRVLQRFIRHAKKSGSGVILIGATEALRRAKNGKAVAQQIGRRLGRPIRLLSKKTEADLGFLGVRASLPPTGRQILIDSGGGSTEICFCVGRRRLQSVSLPIGSGMLSWFLHHDPPQLFEFAWLMKPILESLRSLPQGGRPLRALATGGSAHHLVRLTSSTSTVLTKDGLNRALRKLLKRPASQISRKYGIDPRRVRTLVPGGLILGALLEMYGLNQMTVTQRGVRDGMLEAYREKGDAWWKD